MDRTRLLSPLFALALVAACGGKSAAPATPGGGHGHAHHHQHDHDGEEPHAHGAPGSPVAVFHDELAPLWHAEEGPQRVSDTCDKAGHLHELAVAVVDAGAPAGATADYMDAASALVAACDALHAECNTPERAGFAAKFAAVHDAFHAVAEKYGKIE